jgi:ATP-dependent DNA ligase
MIHDLAKPVNGRYHSDGTSTNWMKIKNPGYTQMTARHELFEPRTGSRKLRLRRLVPRRGARLIRRSRRAAARACSVSGVCDRDMEGMVAKLAQAPYP